MRIERPPGTEVYLDPAHRYVAVVHGVEQGRYTTFAAAMESARILAGSNTSGWYVRDALTGVVWPPESLRVAG